MSDAKVRGTVHVIEDTKTYGQKGFRKRLLVLEQENERFTNYIPVEFLRDDCDRADGLEVGSPCGSDVGECVPGLLVCRMGMVVCDGAIGPEPETCNALDDDCDALVDEALPLGGVCGMSMGACAPGMLQWPSARAMCIADWKAFWKVSKRPFSAGIRSRRSMIGAQPCSSSSVRPTARGT